VITAALGILTASLLGSVHCAAMCSGFVCLYAGSATDTAGPFTAPPLRAHALYNVGRLISYVALGAVAGALGAGVTRLGALAGIGRGATIVAGLLMILWAAHAIVAQRGIRFGANGMGRIASVVPQWWQRTLGTFLHAMRTLPVPTRAFLTGLGTTLLPCGWLYIFVATAGGTGRARDGALVMALFWAGTVPAMLAVGVGAQRFIGPLRRRMPTVGALTVLLMGVLAVSGRLNMSADHQSMSHREAPSVQAPHDH
jgi:sulfite exporter TauE/SafE